LRLQSLLKPGAARNAARLRLLGSRSQAGGKPAWQLAGLMSPHAVHTVLTISLDEPDKMEAAAHAAAHLPLLKLKLAGDGKDVSRVAAVRRAAPATRLIADANEGYRPEFLVADAKHLAELGIEMLEQPLPAAEDEFLRDFDSPLRSAPMKAHTRSNSLAKLAGKYDVINIKLDKTGGMTEALALAEAARAAGWRSWSAACSARHWHGTGRAGGATREICRSRCAVAADQRSHAVPDLYRCANRAARSCFVGLIRMLRLLRRIARRLLRPFRAAQVPPPPSQPDSAPVPTGPILLTSLVPLRATPRLGGA